VNTGLTNTDVSVLAVSGVNLFAGTLGGGVFRSTNNGTTWVSAGAGLTDNLIWSLAVSGSNLFAGTNTSIFLSTNNGASWSSFSEGLPTSYIYALAVAGTDLFAGVFLQGVWRRSILEVTTENHKWN
jgi:hypothetical protein